MKLRSMLYFNVFLSLLFPFSTSRAGEIEFSVRKIWDEAPHNAFTNLVRFNGDLYCSFREGTGHIPGKKTGVGDGAVRVLRSRDGEKWESVALLKKAGYDLRDPKISETPDGRLMLTIGGSIYVNGNLEAWHPMVSFFDKERKGFSDPERIQFDSSLRKNLEWLWRTTWHRGKAYGVLFHLSGNPCVLLKSDNGIEYTTIPGLNFPNGFVPNETTVRFDQEDNIYVLVRSCQGKSGIFAQSPPPYAEWKWSEIGKDLGGPDFLFLPSGKILVGSRTFQNGVGTALFKMDEKGKIFDILRFPSGGDTGYPGMVIDDDTLWVSYYSSHEGKASIYLAKIPIDQIEKKLD